jgi:hypothetical protein
MFVRIRQTSRRLQASLIETHRTDGGVRSVHVASIGTIAVPLSVAGRLAFWEQAHERLARLGNRLDQTARAKLVDELAAKIQMVTEAEQAEADEGKDEFAEGVAILLRAGWSTAKIVRAIRLSKLSDAEVAEVTAETLRGYEHAERAAFNRVYRRRRAVTSRP